MRGWPNRQGVQQAEPSCSAPPQLINVAVDAGIDNVLGALSVEHVADQSLMAALISTSQQ
jgi:hypothetical protein